MRYAAASRRCSLCGSEKTVADCFKFRNKIGLDVALEALSDGWSRGLLSMDTLARHAATDRVGNVMRPYLESVSP
jgi:hypothetical protein